MIKETREGYLARYIEPAPPVFESSSTFLKDINLIFDFLERWPVVRALGIEMDGSRLVMQKEQYIPDADDDQLFGIATSYFVIEVRDGRFHLVEVEADPVNVFQEEVEFNPWDGKSVIDAMARWGSALMTWRRQ